MTIEERIEKMEQDLKEMKQELENKETKQHKSLSDYRVYEELEDGTNYKFIHADNTIAYDVMWLGTNRDFKCLETGNVYLNDTPNELLEREIKKRQLWFALEKYLKENNCLATNEDWKDTTKEKYYIFYDYYNNEFDIGDNLFCKEHNIYSTDKVALYDYMNTLTEEDIKIMFDVEE